MLNADDMRRRECCGGRLMLCDECVHNDGECDYSGGSDSCSRE